MLTAICYLHCILRQDTGIAQGAGSVADMKKATDSTTGERRRSSVATEKVKLNSGHYIPQVALGVYKAPNDNTTEDAVKWAFEAGYRHVDSAARYANEEAVGRAIADFLKTSKVNREELFVTTKLWDADHERAADAVDESLKKLGLDYVDLFLIHSPGNLGPDARAKAWKDLEAAVDAGKVKSIGVSNVSERNFGADNGPVA